jgi:uncharacterized protein
MKIGLISDTHGYLDERVYEYFDACDELWHAGDIGDAKVLQELTEFKPTKAVFGNIDDRALQHQLPEDLMFEREGLKIFMTHIGGVPPHYNPRVKQIINETKPDLFICGHSHILRVMPDNKRPGLLYINPGASGHQGFHVVRTIMRLELKEGKMLRPEVIELGRRGRI